MVVVVSLSEPHPVVVYTVASDQSENFSLRHAVESLMPNQTLNVPPGYYTSVDCGMNIRVDNVTIKSSLGDVVIDCSSMDRHFIIRGSNVTIEGLLLLNGTSTTGCGGCMLIHGNHTIVRNSRFVNCWAAEHGGAISISNLKTGVSLEGVSIQQSEATSGGGVWSRGLLALDNCILTFNTARQHGGAVFVQGPHAFLTAQQTIISSNTAFGGYGGGISMMVRNESVTSCPDQVMIAPDGGGAILNNCTMENNWAETYGGAIFLQDGFALLLEGRGRGTLFEKNVASRGGAIFALFSQNFSVLGRVSFIDNSALGLGDGAALYLRCSCIGTIVGLGDGVRFENNTASIENYGYGGAMFLSDMTTLDISGNVSFVSNQAVGGYGGAMFLQRGGACKISGNVIFVRNIAIGGGAISNCWSGSTDLSGDVRFVDNIGTFGGALDVETESWARVAGRVSFSGNRGVQTSLPSSITGFPPDTPSAGGAVYVTSASLVLRGNVSFENCTADLGGAIFAAPESDLTVGDSVRFRGCTAASGSGGALYIQSSTAWIGGETVVERNAAERGGGLFARFFFFF